MTDLDLLKGRPELQIGEAKFFQLTKKEFLALLNCAGLGVAHLTSDTRAVILHSEVAYETLNDIGESGWNQLITYLDHRSTALWPELQTTYRRLKEDSHGPSA